MQKGGGGGRRESLRRDEARGDGRGGRPEEGEGERGVEKHGKDGG